ncbi:hypothetical protein AB1399_09650 [Hydrogenibacillus schlegelii]|uniref:hypothetical protein n=1 Tax=Hydrogenibacillus schlegelii TaxID=1484 RepID=UPI0012E399FC|nr:hypothetical protein [Hydrogenibacillus schlegelii]
MELRETDEGVLTEGRTAVFVIGVGLFVDVQANDARDQDGVSDARDGEQFGMPCTTANQRPVQYDLRRLLSVVCARFGPHQPPALQNSRSVSG